MPNSASRRPKPPKDFDENPTWTAADFRRAKPMAEAMPAAVEALKRGPGRPKLERAKIAVSLRLDPEVVATFRKTGTGWQVRINDVLLKAAKKLGTGKQKVATGKETRARA